MSLYEKIEKASVMVQEQKHTLLTDKVMLIEPSFNYEEEMRRMFPRLKCIVYRNEQMWFWNNNTPEGFKIITFKDNEVDFSSPREYKIGFTYF